MASVFRAETVDDASEISPANELREPVVTAILVDPRTLPIKQKSKSDWLATVRTAVVVAIQNGAMKATEAAAELRALAEGAESRLRVLIPATCPPEVIRYYSDCAPSTPLRWASKAAQSRAIDAASGGKSTPLVVAMRHQAPEGATSANAALEDALWKRHVKHPDVSIARLGKALRDEGVTNLSNRRLQQIVRARFGGASIAATFGGERVEAALRELRLMWEAPHPNDIWIFDHTGMSVDTVEEDDEEIPFAYLSDDRKEPAKRLMASAILDGCTRRVLARRVWPSAPSTRDSMLVLFDAIIRFGKPRVLYTDNGSDLVSDAMKDALLILGIELRRTPPGDPPGRGKVERWFRTMKSDLLPLLPGYVGGAMPRQWSAEDLWTRGQVERALIDYCENDYNQREHSVTGESPAERYNRLKTARCDMKVPVVELLCLLPHVTRTRTIVGVEFDGRFYIGRKLANARIGARLVIFHDPYNPDTKYAVLPRVTGDPEYLGELCAHDPAEQFRKNEKMLSENQPAAPPSLPHPHWEE